MSVAISAGASKMGVGFCEITSAQALAKRVRNQDRGSGIQLLVNRREVEASDLVTARLANFTPFNVLSGAEFKIQRYGPSGWRIDASSPDGPWPRSAAKLKPGGAGGCYRYNVAEDQPPGRYRFLTKVNSGSQQFSEVAKFSIRRSTR